MNYLAKPLFLSLFFFGHLYGSPAPQNYASVVNQRQTYSGATSYGGGTSGATVIALDRELGRKMNEAIGKHTQSVFQRTQENLQRSLANSENFSRRLQADIEASVQRSLANTQASIAQALASSGILPPSLAKHAQNAAPPQRSSGSGFENLFGIGDDFAKNLQADISRTIAESQAQSRKLQDDLHKITDEAIKKAAKEGKLQVISTSGTGPGGLVSTSVNGQGIILSNNGQPGSVVQVVSDGNSGKTRIYSNVPIRVSGGKPQDSRGAHGGRINRNQPSQFQPTQQKRTGTGVRRAVSERVVVPLGNMRDNIVETDK